MNKETEELINKLCYHSNDNIICLVGRTLKDYPDSYGKELRNYLKYELQESLTKDEMLNYYLGNPAEAFDMILNNDERLLDLKLENGTLRRNISKIAYDLHFKVDCDRIASTIDGFITTLYDWIDNTDNENEISNIHKFIQRLESINFNKKT